MENWKIGLDRYLTTPPYDIGYEKWCEEVLDKKISSDFFNENKDWIEEDNGQCDKWLNKLSDRDPVDAARIIERAFKIYIN